MRSLVLIHLSPRLASPHLEVAAGSRSRRADARRCVCLALPAVTGGGRVAGVRGETAAQKQHVNLLVMSSPCPSAARARNVAVVHVTMPVRPDPSRGVP
jgi:hypothetical protein